jgi:dihydrofolate synthase/folylpolyglutamate synthase
MPTSAKLLAEMKLLHPQLIDLSLGRVERLLGKLGSPHTKLPPVVHVAGTNGKGSVTAYLKAMLEASGARVHVYTSPHLVRHGVSSLPAPTVKAPPAGNIDVLTRTQARTARRHRFEIRRRPSPASRRRAPAQWPRRPLDATNVVSARHSSSPIARSLREARTRSQIAYEAGIHRAGVRSSCRGRAGARAWSAGPRVGAPLVVGRPFDTTSSAGARSRSELLLDLPLPLLIGRHRSSTPARRCRLPAGAPALGLDESRSRPAYVGALAGPPQRLTPSAAVAVALRVRALARRRP